MFAKDDRFRYPLPESEPSPSLDAAYSAAFNSLYKLASATIHTISPSNFPLPPSNAPIVPSTLASSTLPYNASFCSIFNFDRGFLNSHKDRGLITLVSGIATAETTDSRVSLWCERHDGTWIDIGSQATVDDIVIFSGDQLTAATDGKFRAVEHACRVDPMGERINTTLKSEPSAGEGGNRQSIALVLCAAEDGE